MPQKNNNALLCEPHDGSRGTSFTRTWLPMFMMHLVGIIDDSGECLAANVDEIDEGSQHNPIDPLDPNAGPQERSRHQKKHAQYRARCNKAIAC